jgi:gliding motility-associated-like protein
MKILPKLICAGIVLVFFSMHGSSLSPWLRYHRVEIDVLDAKSGARRAAYGDGESDAFIACFSACDTPRLHIPNGGYVCNSPPFVLRLDFEGDSPFTFTYAIDGLEQAPVTTELTTFFFSLEGDQWRDSVVILEVRSGDCVGEISGLPYIRNVEPLSHSEPRVACDATSGTYTVAFDLSGGMFGYLAVEPTEGFVSGDTFTSAAIPIGEEYELWVTSDMRCDTVVVRGAPDCPVDCAPPAITAGADSPVCAGEAISLSASGGANYAWTGPNGFNSDQQNPVIDNASVANAGDYTVRVVDSEGCEATAVVAVLVNPSPTAAAVAAATSVCVGASIELNAGGGVAYSWSGPGGFASNEQNPIIAAATETQAGDYVVMVFDANGCVDSAMISIEVGGDLTGAEARANSPLCVGQTLRLTASGGAIYAWTGPGGFASEEQNPVIENIAASGDGEYAVIISDPGGCEATLRVEVIVDQRPKAEVDAQETLCAGDTATLDARGGESFLWSTGETNARIRVSPPGDVTYTLIAFNGPCSDTVAFDLAVLPAPSIQTSGSTTIKPGQQAPLSASGGEIYAWSPPEGLSCLDCPNPLASPEVTTTYCVTGTSGGCDNRACVTVTLDDTCPIFVPNAFSPNGDGVNDAFCVYSDCIESMTLRIFDRWGALLFQTNEVGACWDGKLQGREMMQGVYVYLMEGMAQGRAFLRSGEITLVR